jgi:hypothetical protein
VQRLADRKIELQGADSQAAEDVDEQNQVVFRTVKLLSVSTEGAWVTGLPDEVPLITRGGVFDSEGELA